MRDPDTSAAAHRAQIDALRRLGPEGRLALALEMSDDARAISEAGRGVRWDGEMDDAAKCARIRFYYGIEIPIRHRSRQ
jgi:hypothetical protein